MFANNEQISWYQLFCQMVLSLLGSFLLLLPGEEPLFGLSGVVAGVIAFLLLCLYFVWLVRLAPSYNHLEKSVGKVGMQGASLVFLGYFILTGAFLVSFIGEVTTAYMTIDVLPWGIHMVTILACAMAGIPNIQRRGRLAEFVFPFLGGALMILLLLAISQQRGTFWGCVKQNTFIDVDVIANGVWKVLVVTTCVGAVPFLLGNVRGKRYLGLISGAGVIFSFFIIMMVMLQGSYGTNQILQREWPAIAVMSSVRFPGGFIFRMDPIWIALLLFLLLFSLGSCFFYGNYIVKRTELQIPWYLIYGCVFVLSLMEFPWGTVKDIYFPCVAVFFAPVILLWNIFLGIKSRRNIREK